MIDLRIDDEIAKIVGELSIFKYINPNVITSFGIVLNFFIIYLLFYRCGTIDKDIFIVLISVSLLLRCLADILDGYVARKYKKTSNIGHKLDTFSDLTILSVYILLFFNRVLKINLAIIVLLIICFIIFMDKRYHLLDNHDEVKNGKGSLINDFSRLSANNTVFLYILMIFISIIYFNKECALP